MIHPDPIKCLLVDDEPPARDIVRRYIADLPMLDLAGECGNALDALNFLQTEAVDLLFLDIRMPQLMGTELIRIMKTPPKVIFTTAHPDYAMEGYDLDIVDYLLKPIPFNRFVKAVNKAMQLIRPIPVSPYPSPGHPLSGPGHPPETRNTSPSEDTRREPFLYFRSERKMVKVMLKDILYIESMKDYIKLYTTSGLILTKQSISSVEAMLPEQQFIRIHRSFIVSSGQIRSYTSELVQVDKTELPIGKLYRNSVLKALATP